MKNRKIILTVTNDLTYDRRMHRICQTLANAGAEALLTGRKLDHSTDFNPISYKIKRLQCVFNKGPLFYVEYNFRLFFFLLFQSFDAVCAIDLDTALPARITAFLKGKPSVYDAHEFFTEVPELLQRPLIKSFWEFIGKLTIRGFSLRYTVSESLANILSEKYKAPFLVVRNIPTVQQAKVPGAIDNRDRKILLYVGALNVGRGLESTIQAMVNLHGWEFWLAGEGDIRDDLQKLSGELEVQQKVKFLGWVKPEDLSVLMRSATLGINVLDDRSVSYYYSLANKFFDFIHASLPSINMNFPEYAAIQEKYHCSHLVEKSDARTIQAAIQYLDEHPSEVELIKLGCARAAADLTWEKESMHLLEAYHQLFKK